MMCVVNSEDITLKGLVNSKLTEYGARTFIERRPAPNGFNDIDIEVTVFVRVDGVKRRKDVVFSEEVWDEVGIDSVADFVVKSVKADLDHLPTAVEMVDR